MSLFIVHLQQRMNNMQQQQPGPAQVTAPSMGGQGNWPSGNQPDMQHQQMQYAQQQRFPQQQPQPGYGPNPGNPQSGGPMYQQAGAPGPMMRAQMQGPQQGQTRSPMPGSQPSDGSFR